MSTRHPFRDTSRIRGRGARGVASRRQLYGPAIPTGVHTKQGPQMKIFLRPRISRRENEADTRRRYKQVLLERFDTDERNRRDRLTVLQHRSPYGNMDSEGFRKFTTVKGIPYDRDQSPHQRHENLVRQYAFGKEFIQSQKMLHSGDMDVFRWKRAVYTFRKTQPVRSGVTGK